MKRNIKEYRSNRNATYHVQASSRDITAVHDQLASNFRPSLEPSFTPNLLLSHRIPALAVPTTLQGYRLRIASSVENGAFGAVG